MAIAAGQSRGRWPRPPPILAAVGCRAVRLLLRSVPDSQPGEIGHLNWPRNRMISAQPLPRPPRRPTDTYRHASRHVPAAPCSEPALLDARILVRKPRWDQHAQP
jgi:hypothetical protein